LSLGLVETDRLADQRFASHETNLVCLTKLVKMGRNRDVPAKGNGRFREKAGGTSLRSQPCPPRMPGLATHADRSWPAPGPTQEHRRAVADMAPFASLRVTGAAHQASFR